MKVLCIYRKIFTKIFLLSICLSISLITSSQNDCATPTPTVDFLQTIPANQKVAAFSNANLKVAIYIIRKTNGSAGVPPVDAINAFNDMVAKYAPYNICFSLIGLHFLDFNSYYNTVFTTDAQFNSLMDDNSLHSDAIEIFLVPSTSSGINGRARNIPGKAFVVWNNAVGNGSTMAHEMGHCLGLFHTFETFFCVENNSSNSCGIGGNNSDICGDLICDTPADPDLTIDASCNYIGGGGFNPLTTNIMSRAPVSCRTQFTNDQKSRMLLTVANNPILSNCLVSQNVIVSNIIFPYFQTFPSPPQFITSKNYVAKNDISTSGVVVIGNSAEVRFLAENQIVLNPGFQADRGSIFKAKIDVSCPPNFNFRTTQQGDNNSGNNGFDFNTNELSNLNLLNIPSQNRSFLLMPNPTTSSFKLLLDNNLEYPKQIIIRDVLGRIVTFVEKPDSYDFDFSLAEEKDGVYIVIVYYSNNTFSKRIIKN